MREIRHPHALKQTKEQKKQQLQNLACVLGISYEGVLKLKPQIEVATDCDKNSDFLLIEICGNPPKALLHKIHSHIVAEKYIHLQYGTLDNSFLKAN